MRKIFFSILLIYLFISSSFAKEVGKITALNGDVDILHNKSIPGEKAKLNQLLYLNDVIRTKTNSNAEVTLNDGTIIKIYQKSRVDISEYFLDGENLKVKIDLKRGKVGAYVSKQTTDKIVSSSKENRFEIRTPVAVSGVKGTKFIVSHGLNHASTILVISGNVYVYNLNFPDKIVELKDGEMSIIREKSTPSTPIGTTNEDITLIEASSETNAKNDSNSKNTANPPLTEQNPIDTSPKNTIKHNSYIDSYASDIFTGDSSNLGINSGINATFSGNSFWVNTPSDTFLNGNIVDSSNQISFSSGYGYIWNAKLKNDNLACKYYGYLGGTLSQKTDSTYNMNAYIAGIYSDENNNKGIFVGSLGGDGFSNVSMADKSFALNGVINSAVVLGTGSIPEPTDVYRHQVNEIFDIVGSNLTSGSIVISNSTGEFVNDISDYNFNFGAGIYAMGGTYTSMPAGNWYISLRNPATDKFAGFILHGTLFENYNGLKNIIKGKVYGYYLDYDGISTNSSGIFVGETIGTFNPSESKWQTMTPFVLLKTDNFLNLVDSEAGRQKLNSIGVPSVEIGRDTLVYQDINCTNCINSVIMKDVRFFSSSASTAPTIWATNQINGTFNGVVSNTPVTLYGNSISVHFKPERWDANSWTSSISNGSGTIGGYSIQNMEGYAIGTVSGNNFSGTAAGAVKAQP